MMRMVGGSEYGYANVCPRCESIYGQTYLDDLFRRISNRLKPPVKFSFAVAALPAKLRPTWPDPHYCADGCGETNRGR